MKFNGLVVEWIYPRRLEVSQSFIYKKAVDKKLVRGRSIEGEAAACIYMTCRIHRIPRTLDEIDYILGQAERNWTHLPRLG